jgi:hypothetical protein
MKPIRGDHEEVLYHLGRHERDLFLSVLRRYPLLPQDHQPLSRHSPVNDSGASEQMLQDALTEQRSGNRSRVESLVRDRRRFQETESGWILVLSPADREWLLQVLNDVRVGSWLRLGSPEKELRELELDARTAPDAMTMEMAGLFQMLFLERPA